MNITPPRLRTATIAASLLGALAFGCERSEPKPPTPGPAPSGAAAPSSAAENAPARPASSAAADPAPPAQRPAAPAKAQSLTDLGPISGPDDNPAVLTIAGITAPKPVEWTWQQPSMQFRNLQYAVPAPGGKGEPAELIVSAFVGDDGGPLEPNIQRWIGQFKTDTGEPVTPVRSEMTVDGMPVHVIELKGKYLGMGAAASRPGITQLGAIVETGQARVFIRLLGQDATVEAARPAWDAMLKGLKRGGAS